MEKRYSLFGFMIIERDDFLGWIQHVGDLKDTGEMVFITGKAYIDHDHDVLLLGRSTSMDIEPTMKSFDAVEEYLGSLPKWDKTRYYVKLADIELYSLIECDTGEVVFSDRNREIKRNLLDTDTLYGDELS
jgi:hypothetical protein